MRRLFSLNFFIEYFVIFSISILTFLSFSKPLKSQSALPTISCIPFAHSCTAGISICCSPYVCMGGYCVTYTSPTPTNTPTPSYSICTGLDGSDPCQQYNCSGIPSPCEQHGGTCLLGYCYPTTCRCGFSQYDCPNSPNYIYRCQSSSNSTECNEGEPTECRPGYVNCTNGLIQLQCTNSADCIYECGDDLAYCHSLYGCYVPSTCGALEEGAGTCTTTDACPDERETRQLDCLPNQICCAPPPECIGTYTGEPGTCYFISCPPDTYYDGSNPPDSTGCGFLEVCCTNPSDEWIQRNSLNPECTTSQNTVGINTAVGCIGVTNPTTLLSFILPWAIGVGGGTSLILIIVAGFLVMTSGGDPQKARAGKDLLGSAIAGLILIIFSVYILNVIGIRILKIPGL